MLTRTGRAWQISVLAACGIVLTAVLVGTGLSLRLSVAAGLVLLALLWATAHVVTGLELAYPVTRRGRLRAAAVRSEPLLAFTGAALAARNAAGRAWHTAHTGEADRHQKARSDLALALTALDEELPRVLGLGLPKATEAATRLHTELHALGAGCTPSTLQNDQDRLAAQNVIGTPSRCPPRPHRGGPVDPPLKPRRRPTHAGDADRQDMTGRGGATASSDDERTTHDVSDLPEPEMATVRIPKAAQNAFAAAVAAEVVATFKDDSGLDWYYAWGTREVDHLEVALLPGGDEVMLRMSSDRAATIVCPIERWYELVGRMTPPGQGPQEA